MKCPVCKTECGSNDVCPECGFDECNNAFINHEEVEVWNKEKVIPYRNNYIKKISSLSGLKERMLKYNTKEAYDAFWNKFIELVNLRNNGEWLPIPSNGNGNSIELIIKNYKGEHYIAVYSGMEGRTPGESKNIIHTSIDKVIDALYSNPHLHGIVFDPNKNPYYIHRKKISWRTNMKDPRIQIKEWGVGIPNYTEKDVMVPEELLDFAMEITENNHIQNEGYEILDSTSSIDGFPNFVLKKDGQLYMMKVRASVEQDIAEISERDKEFYLSQCSKFNAKCLCTTVGISSSDEMRAARGLALCGDEFSVRVNEVVELN